MGGSVNCETMNALIGERLRRRRRALGLTQGDVGRRCGVSLQQIQKYEAGARTSAARLWSLSQVLDVPVAFFFEGVADVVRAPLPWHRSSARPDGGDQRPKPAARSA